MKQIKNVKILIITTILIAGFLTPVITGSPGPFDVALREINGPVDEFEPVVFKAIIANGVVEDTMFEWDFGNGDGTSGYGKDTVTYVYQNAGTYTVTVDASYNGQEASDSIQVVVEEVPLSCYIEGPTYGKEKEQLCWTGHASGGSGIYLSWEWVLEGPSGTPINLIGQEICLELFAGEYTLTMTVTDSEGETCTEVIGITIEPDIEEYITIRCNAFPKNIFVGTKTLLTVTVTYVEGDDPVCGTIKHWVNDPNGHNVYLKDIPFCLDSENREDGDSNLFLGYTDGVFTYHVEIHDCPDQPRSDSVDFKVYQL